MVIGIIGAMDQEIHLLKESMSVKSEETIANCHFIKGQLGEKEIVLLKSGIGKVNAALATAILHERYQPTCIINTGSAGGYDKSLSVGDLVISDEVTHHDVDVTAFNYSYGQVPKMPARFKADDNLIKSVSESVKSIEDVQYKLGLIGTGDSFIETEAQVQVIKDHFPDMLALEMEAAAIAQVCHQYETPFVIIRALSDIAGKKSSLSFDQFLEVAAKNAAVLIMSTLRKL
ncbi:adenosylhomocysteine nucleosidase [Pelagirhabdus alkalitolerans]|uniref:5'-methylthioadenosine/S-adenosylhomocysteine nucleosidase n=1 Tax=Pelagirhabdus alkalitolerans TaxID=1612202 RepID=A0A1G6HT40_9BACI|nr:5'-methylthioadenosine/S-adenosylhomocysteine nucleosidase [Pelagirhabdus alkalitolerans]SDB97402.1 adenosylhomocysteine nucleosidase [Pelagirhabdus alkalitolerans]